MNYDQLPTGNRYISLVKCIVNFPLVEVNQALNILVKVNQEIRDESMIEVQSRISVKRL